MWWCPGARWCRSSNRTRLEQRPVARVRHRDDAARGQRILRAKGLMMRTGTAVDLCAELDQERGKASAIRR